MERIKSLVYKGTTQYGVPRCGYENIQGNPIYYGIPQNVLDAAWVSQRWGDIREHRDRLIQETDWTQTIDCPLSDDKKAEFSVYRKALRDIPQTYSDPDSVVWPEKPAI